MQSKQTAPSKTTCSIAGRISCMQLKYILIVVYISHREMYCLPSTDSIRFPRFFTCSFAFRQSFALIYTRWWEINGKKNAWVHIFFMCVCAWFGRDVCTTSCQTIQKKCFRTFELIFQLLRWIERLQMHNYNMLAMMMAATSAVAACCCCCCCCILFPMDLLFLLSFQLNTSFICCRGCILLFLCRFDIFHFDDAR